MWRVLRKASSVVPAAPAEAMPSAVVIEAGEVITFAAGDAVLRCSARVNSLRPFTVCVTSLAGARTVSRSAVLFASSPTTGSGRLQLAVIPSNTNADRSFSLNMVGFPR